MDLTDRVGLARRLAAIHRSTMTGYAAALPTGATAPIAGGLAVFTAPGWPLNRLGGLPPDAVLDDAALRALRAFHSAHGGKAEIEADPMVLSVPGTLEGLAAHRFRPVWQRTALARPLDMAVPEPERTGRPAVRRAPDPDAFAALIASGFAEGAACPPDSFGYQVQALAQAMPGAAALVAAVDGRPGGGGALRIVDGTCCLFGQSTLPEARRRGVQTAIVAESLRFGAAAGCDVAVVDANPGTISERTLLKAGFQTIWTTTGFRQT